MALQKSWVDRIFEKLSMVYGSRFVSMWSGVSLDAVKADWAHELSGFEGHPAAIKYALQNLPTNDPPNVLQFRDLCRRAPAQEKKELPAPRPDKERAAESIKKAMDAIKVGCEYQGHKRVLEGLKNIERSGRKLTLAQRDFLKRMQAIDDARRGVNS